MEIDLDEQFGVLADKAKSEYYEMTPDDHIRSAASELGMLDAVRTQREPDDDSHEAEIDSLASAQAHALMAIAKTLTQRAG